VRGEGAGTAKEKIMSPRKILDYWIEQRVIIERCIAATEQMIAAEKRRGRPSKARMEARKIASGKRSK